MAESHFSGKLAGYELTPGYQAGAYYSVPAIGLTTSAPPLSTMRCHPFLLSQDNRFDQIAVEVTTVGAGSTVRLGIYAADANEAVGSLILDAGTVDSSSGTVKSIAVNLFLLTGLYWLAAVSQGGTAPQLRCNQFLDVVNLPVLAGLNPAVGLEMTGVTGALPLVAPSPQALSTPTPRVYLRST